MRFTALRVPAALAALNLAAAPLLAQTGSASAAGSPAAPAEYFGGDSVPRAPAARGGNDGLRYDARRGVELGFVDADIRRVVDAILGGMLKVAYTVDPAVQGTITLSSARSVARDSLIPALEAALATVNAAIVRQGGVYRVVPRTAATAAAGLSRPLTARERTQPGFSLEVVPLRFASAREVQKVVEGSGAKDAILQVDETRNQLIVVGSSQERAAIRRLIESLDVDWVRGMSFTFYRVDSVPPDELIGDLGRVFKPPLDILASRVRLVPFPRLKAILGIAASREDLRQIESWIRRLDSGAGADKRKLYVYNVQNGRAADIANSLSLVISGDAGVTYTAAPALPSTPGGTTEESKQQEAPIGTSRAPRAATAVGGGNTLRVVPNDENNSLLIYATPSEHEFVMDALRQLDVPPRQVLIEAILAEVTLTNDLRYGLQWFFSPGSNEITLSTQPSGGVSSQFPGFSYLYTGSADARVVLNAIQSKTNVRVLSSPKLVVLNNQTATLQVGDQVPIVTQSSQSTSAGGAPVVNTVELRDTGVILKVTPRVNDSGLVIVDVSQEVSDVAATTSSGIDSPTIQQRKLTSTVATRSGSTVALGGLIRDGSTRGRSGVPFIQNVPLVGNLFRTTTRDDRRTELVVLLTPTVMRDAVETEAAVDDLIDGFTAIRPLIDKGIGDQVPARRAQKR